LFPNTPDLNPIKCNKLNDTPYPSITNVVKDYSDLPVTEPAKSPNFAASVQTFQSSSDDEFMVVYGGQGKVEKLLSVFKAATSDLRTNCRRMSKGGQINFCINQVEIVCGYIDLAR
jgi:hypothetical protein